MPHILEPSSQMELSANLADSQKGLQARVLAPGVNLTSDLLAISRTSCNLSILASSSVKMGIDDSEVCVSQVSAGIVGCE